MVTKNTILPKKRYDLIVLYMTDGPNWGRCSMGTAHERNGNVMMLT
jgi:hypothetical protein